MQSLPKTSSMVVYYESIKRELKTRPIYECRCDERLKPKGEESTRLAYTGLLGKLEPFFSLSRIEFFFPFFFLTCPRPSNRIWGEKDGVARGPHEPARHRSLGEVKGSYVHARFVHSYGKHCAYITHIPLHAKPLSYMWSLTLILSY
jgi:hypothetical protein